MRKEAQESDLTYFFKIKWVNTHFPVLHMQLIFSRTTALLAKNCAHQVNHARAHCSQSVLLACLMLIYVPKKRNRWNLGRRNLGIAPLFRNIHPVLLYHLK